MLQDNENVFAQIKIQIEKKLSYQECSPENPDENLKFWNSKVKEMFMEGKDLETYDLNPEWTSGSYSRNPSSPQFPHSLKNKNSVTNSKNSRHNKINNNQNKPKKKMNVEKPLNIVDVLMQLLALKNQLGSLEPKVIDLLIEGLEMEKIELESSIKLLTPDNCVMFGKIKEKLKVQLLARAVKKSSMNAIKFAICNIVNLMQLAPKFIDTSAILSSESTHTSASVTERKDITVDELKQSPKTNQTLLTQGKVDVILKEFGTLLKKIKEKHQLNIIDVLRPLVVLENKLGLLAHKIIDLLVNSLKMEKIKLESFSNTLTSDICEVFISLDVIPFENFNEKISAGLLKSRLKNSSTLTVRYMVKLTQLPPAFTPTSSMLNSECTSKYFSFIVTFHFHPSQSSSPNSFLTVQKQLNNNYNISPEFSSENYHLKEQSGEYNYLEDQPNLREQLDLYSGYLVNNYSDYHSKFFNKIDDKGIIGDSDYRHHKIIPESTFLSSKRCSKKKKTHKGSSNTLYYEKYHGTP